MHLHLRATAVAIGLAVASSVAMATPTGLFSFGIVPNGLVTVSATRIDFAPPTNPASGPVGIGDFATGNSSISYGSGSTLTGATNPYGQIKDLDVMSTPTPLANFIQFYVGTSLPTPPGTGALAPAPVFDLTQINPGGSAQGALGNCAGVTAIGTSCSPLVTVGNTTFVSPFVLTNRGAYTDVSLGLTLLGRDGVGPDAVWGGGLTTQVTFQNGTRLTPDAIQTLINGGGSITAGSTFSSTFAFLNTVNPVPEPATVSLIGVGLAAIGFFGRKLQKNS